MGAKFCLEVTPAAQGYIAEVSSKYHYDLPIFIRSELAECTGHRLEARFREKRPGPGESSIVVGGQLYVIGDALLERTGGLRIVYVDDDEIIYKVKGLLVLAEKIWDKMPCFCQLPFELTP